MLMDTGKQLFIKIIIIQNSHLEVHARLLLVDKINIAAACC